MQPDVVRRILAGQPEPISRNSIRTLIGEVQDWATNRRATGLDNRVLDEVVRHLKRLLELEARP